MNPKTPKRSYPRYETQLVADLFLNKWNPFSKKKVVILDLSWQGFKIEFLNEKNLSVKNGSNLTLLIPIKQFNISNLKDLKLEIIVKWCDKESRRIGGVFIHPSGEKSIILGNIIQKLAILKQSEDDIDEGSAINQRSMKDGEAS